MAKEKVKNKDEEEVLLKSLCGVKQVLSDHVYHDLASNRWFFIYKTVYEVVKGEDSDGNERINMVLTLEVRDVQGKPYKMKLTQFKDTVYSKPKDKFSLFKKKNKAKTKREMLRSDDELMVIMRGDRVFRDKGFDRYYVYNNVNMNKKQASDDSVLIGEIYTLDHFKQLEGF